MLTEALSFEEITISRRLLTFLRELRDSDMDAMTRIEIERKIGRMLEESISHSKMITHMLKKVMKSEQAEF